MVDTGDCITLSSVVSLNRIPAHFQLITGIMGVFGLYSLIVACRFGAVAFMFVYFQIFSFCIVLLHSFSVYSTVFDSIGVLIAVHSLSCKNVFILCLYSSCVLLEFCFVVVFLRLLLISILLTCYIPFLVNNCMFIATEFLQ